MGVGGGGGGGSGAPVYRIVTVLVKVTDRLSSIFKGGKEGDAS